MLQFITPAGFYGAERWVIALANNLPGEHMICDLAVTRESASQDLSVAEHYPEHAGQVHYIPMTGRFDVRAVLRLIEIIRNRRIDVIHTHGYKSDILGLLAARRAGIKCVSTPHGFSGKVGFKLGAFIKLGTFMLRYFDAVVPLSEELMADMKRFGVPESRTHFIRNGVDLKEIDKALQDSQASQEDPVASRVKTIGFIGQMIPRKGLGDLLQSFDRLHQNHPQYRLQLLGDGRQRAALEEQAANLDSGNAIEFLGFRTDRLALLSRFDLFVMTSSLEGIPRCMMEAMAVGIPVVAYDIPGVDQLIEHEKTGLLAPPGDREALARCCERVLEDGALAQSLTTAAHARIDNDYSAARMAREYEVLFQKLLDNSAATVVSDRGGG
ncbi:glycosyl transferase family 1 [Marinobacter zhanjiangensis]|uniref:Glycosyl transferase family 1 n=1 Tax=Marinobacter zhanjiangensis TaxID=578215 RepID=A0ABQ3B712_9GAMM|nr:glycosyl transferase family 1 [Marinobacter zhanjiangensis]